MPREAPAVVQRPQDRDPDPFQMLHQQRNIQIVAMNITEMNDVRIPGFDVSDQLPRSVFGPNLMMVCEPVQAYVAENLGIRSDPFRMDIPVA